GADIGYPALALPLDRRLIGAACRKIVEADQARVVRLFPARACLCGGYAGPEKRGGEDAEGSCTKNRWRLQGPDLDLAPFDGAAGRVLRTVAELQGEGAARELAVADVHRLLAVQLDDQLRAPGRNQERV